MIKRCSNCSGRLTFDIKSQAVKCSSCESCFDVTDIPETADINPNNLDEVTKIMDCNVYICNSCGAEIIINDTEVSTFCVYCGNSSIVFSRMDKLKRPDAIIPFRVTREQAERSIRNNLNSGILIPKDIKNFEVDTLRPIYIPYYISNLECYGSAILQSTVGSGKNSTTYNYLRGGRCTFDRITTDASKKLNDSTSERLEPFNHGELKPFDEDYLLGFYADKADVTPLQAENTAKVRAIKLFEESMINSISEGSNKKFVNKSISAKKISEAKYVFLPAWFLTFRYNDHPYTLLVNGQTGKIVGGVPWNERLFNGIFASIFLAVSILSTCVLGPLTYTIFESSSSNGVKSGVRILTLLVVIACSALGAGLNKMTKVKNSIKRASETTLTSFVKDRQSV